MIFLIALRIPAFAFCECQQDVVLNSGTCCVEESVNEDCCHCCDEIQEVAEASPCNDCLRVIALDPGAFHWSPTTFQLQASQALYLPASKIAESALSPQQELVERTRPIRGSPPAPFLAHLRTQVLIL